MNFILKECENLGKEEAIKKIREKYAVLNEKIDVLLHTDEEFQNNKDNVYSVGELLRAFARDGEKSFYYGYGVYLEEKILQPEKNDVEFLISMLFDLFNQEKNLEDRIKTFKHHFKSKFGRFGFLKLMNASFQIPTIRNQICKALEKKIPLIVKFLEAILLENIEVYQNAIDMRLKEHKFDFFKSKFPVTVTRIICSLHDYLSEKKIKFQVKFDDSLLMLIFKVYMIICYTNYFQSQRDLFQEQLLNLILSLSTFCADNLVVPCCVYVDLFFTFKENIKKTLIMLEIFRNLIQNTTELTTKNTLKLIFSKKIIKRLIKHSSSDSKDIRDKVFIIMETINSKNPCDVLRSSFLVAIKPYSSYLTRSKYKRMKKFGKKLLKFEGIDTLKCYVCRKRGKLYKCSRCKNYFYCSRECQKKHWKTHKLYCTPRKENVKGSIKRLSQMKSLKNAFMQANYVEIFQSFISKNLTYLNSVIIIDLTNEKKPQYEIVPDEKFFGGEFHEFEKEMQQKMLTWKDKRKTIKNSIISVLRFTENGHTMQNTSLSYFGNPDERPLL